MKYSIILLFLVLPFQMVSQVDSTTYHPNYLFISLSGDLIDTRDHRQTPLIYFGAGMGFNLGYYREGETFTQEVNIENHAGGAININSEMSGSYLVYFGQLDYGLLKNTNKTILGANLKWGGYSHNRVVSRLQSDFSNNSISYDVIFGIDAAAQLTKEFKFLKKSFDLSTMSRLGIMNFYMEPSFSYPAPFGFSILADNMFQQVMKSFDFAILTGLPSFEFEGKIQHKMYNGNQWALFYDWQFHKIKSDYVRYAAFHSFGMTLFFNL